VSLEEFNALPADEARRRVAGCLEVPRWVEAIVGGRPYAAREDVLAVAARAGDHLDDDELARALSRHPRIGERADAARHDAAHSDQEQAGVDREDEQVAQRLTEGNRAYEERFERVFLIRAAGRDAHEILAELDRRLGNDDETERRETVDQLVQIALLRLERMI
jgi:2-oxo-4-hydroxy-4-carboxy-5-ureidoimidazoline decarboxylase